MRSASSHRLLRRRLRHHLSRVLEAQVQPAATRAAVVAHQLAWPQSTDVVTALWAHPTHQLLAGLRWEPPVKLRSSHAHTHAPFESPTAAACTPTCGTARPRGAPTTLSPPRCCPRVQRCALVAPGRS